MKQVTEKHMKAKLHVLKFYPIKMNCKKGKTPNLAKFGQN